MTTLRFHMAVMLLALLLAPASATATAEAMAERSETTMADGFGRLVIDWAEPVAVTTKETPTLLEIAASRPFPLDPDAVARDLAPLLDAVSLDQGRMRLRLRPASGVAIEAVVLDERSIRLGIHAADAPTLGLRIGRHAGFRRLVFEPVDQRKVHLSRETGRLVLTLPGRLSSADRQRLEAVPGLTGVTVAGNQLFLRLSSDATATDLFVAPDKQVLDIAVDATSTTNTASAIAKGGQSGALAALRPRARPVAPLVPTEPVPAGDAPSATDGREGQPPSQAPDTVASWRSGDPLPVAVDAVERDDGTIALRFAWPAPVPAAAFVRGTTLWVLFGALNRSIDIDTEAFTRIARQFVTTMSEEQHASATVFRLTLGNDAVVSHVENDAGEWRLALGTKAVEPVVPVAGRLAQQSGDALLLSGIETVVSLADPAVGDSLEVGLASLPTDRMLTGRRFAGLHLLPSLQGFVWHRLVETSSAARLEPAGLILGSADGFVRDVAGGDGKASIEAPSAMERPATSAPGPSVSAMTEPTPALPSPTDPPSVTTGGEAGDDAGLAGDAGPGRLPAAEPSELSPAPIERRSASLQNDDPLNTDDRGVTPLLDLARFGGGRGRHFWDQRAALLRAADEAEDGGRRAAELELVRLLVAHGLGAEALTVLDEASASAGAPSGAADTMPAHLALEGAAQVLAGRYVDAVDRLSAATLQADDETALWRAAARAANGDWDAALPDWQRGRDHLDAYPPSIRAALAEHVVMLLLQTGRIEDAFATIEQLSALNLAPAVRDRLRLLEATALERDGAVDEARTIWKALTEKAVPEVRSLASLALVESDLAADRIDASAAVERLAADSVHWRGQRDEVDLWRRLAALRHASGQAQAALAILQEALSREPPPATAAVLSGDMVKIVDTIFAEFAAGERSAMSALLVYRRFAELVPPGPSGDADVGLLAQRLAEIGLAEAAIDLLRERLRYSDARDQGRATLGLTLARLLVHKSERQGAVEALLDTAPIDDIDPELAEARRVLLTTLGRHGKGTTTGDLAAPMYNGPATLRNRTRAAFVREDWLAVLEAAGPLESVVPPSGSLDRAATELVLMVATAARQRGDDAMVERLAARYADRFMTSADADALRLLASPIRLHGEASEIPGAAAAQSEQIRTALAPDPAS